MSIQIREIRRQAKMSQAELAEKSGVSRAIISKLETNPDAVVKNITLSKIATALGVPVSSFFALDV